MTIDVWRSRRSSGDSQNTSSLVFSGRSGLCPRIRNGFIVVDGAPGSGKGATTPYVLKARGLAKAINVSSLLANDQNAAETLSRK